MPSSPQEKLKFIEGDIPVRRNGNTHEMQAIIESVKKQLRAQPGVWAILEESITSHGKASTWRKWLGTTYQTASRFVGTNRNGAKLYNIYGRRMPLHEDSRSRYNV